MNATSTTPPDVTKAEQSQFDTLLGTRITCNSTEVALERPPHPKLFFRRVRSLALAPKAPSILEMIVT
jgi:hypothetical protein